MVTKKSFESINDLLKQKRIALLIPCYNEELTIEQVINDFRNAMPGIIIYVFDNNSTDRTAKLARNSGAIVYSVHERGKGNVVRKMFREIDSDLYVLVDGDSTYYADDIINLLKTYIEFQPDMVVGNRLLHYEDNAFRRMHMFGNKLISKIVSILFRVNLKDVLSGFRLLTKRVVDNLYIKSSNFEVETEITLQALKQKFSIAEVPIKYRSRPEGSKSKLNTFLDGVLIFKTIFMIFRDYKPLVFFGTLSLITFLCGLVFGFFPVCDYIKYKYVYHVPLAILSASLEILAVSFLMVALILDTIVNYNAELNFKITKLREELDKIKDDKRIFKNR